MLRWVVPMFLAVGGLFAACGTGDGRPETAGGGTGPTTTTTVDSCADPAEGCPCTPTAVKAECKVYRKSGNSVSCSTGVTTCGSDGKWGVCEGAAMVWDGGP